MTPDLRPFVAIADAIALVLRPRAEVVLHDLATGTIAHIAHGWSKRRVGEPSLIEEEPAFDLACDIIGPYPKTNWDGRRMKSITTVLRTPSGASIGLLCINLDIEAMAGAMEMLRGLIDLPQTPPPPALFAADWREAINTVVAEYLAHRGLTLAALRPADTDALLGALDRAGVFALRTATPYVAEVLGLSRATIYNRLRALRRAPV